MIAALATFVITASAVVGYLVGRGVRTRSVVVPSDDEPSEPTGLTSAHERVSDVSLRDAIDRLEVGVLICNGDGEVVFRNSRVGELAGTHVGLVVGNHVSKIVAATLVNGSAEQIVELHGPPKQTLEITSDPMSGGGVVVTLRDVSERVRTDTMRTDFVANISHELRTPVGAIAVLAEALEDVDDLETVHRLAHRLVDDAHRAVDTIDDLMELSLIESRDVKSDQVDVVRLVEKAIARGQSVADGRQLDIAAIGIDEPLLVLADRTQLLAALGNLVENAVKYSHDGGVIQLRVRRDERWLELMITDQGVGIPARDIDRVFERFYRVDKARGRSTGGSGLGLSIARHVAENHGGDISVSSLEGEGSTFVLRLPAGLIVDATDDGNEGLAGSTGDRTRETEQT